MKFPLAVYPHWLVPRGGLEAFGPLRKHASQLQWGSKPENYGSVPEDKITLLSKVPKRSYHGSIVKSWTLNKAVISSNLLSASFCGLGQDILYSLFCPLVGTWNETNGPMLAYNIRYQHAFFASGKKKICIQTKFSFAQLTLRAWSIKMPSMTNWIT